MAILQSLQRDPIKSFWAISEELGISAPTVKKRYNHLVAKYPNSFDVEAILRYEKLGLHLIDVFIELNHVKNAREVEKILHQHNYIRFTGQCIGIGAHTGIFAQFILSNELIKDLDQYLDELKQKDLIQGYHYAKQSLRRIALPPELDNFDLRVNRWKLSNQSIIANFAKIQDQSSTYTETPITPFNLKKLTIPHLIVLEELSFNARRSVRQIYKDRIKLNENPLYLPGRSSLKLEVSLSSFIATMKDIDPNRSQKKSVSKSKKSSGLIDRYRLNYSSQLLSIFDTCLFKGTLKSPELGNQILNLLEKENPFKLRMNFSLYNETEFLWYIPIPSQYFVAFKQGISEYIAEDFQVIWMNYGSSANFTFWPENFDITKHKWKSHQ